MRVFIQNCVTGQFLGVGGVWRRSVDGAKDFKGSFEAINYCTNRRLEDAQIVLHFDYDPRLDIELPFSDSCHNKRRESRKADLGVSGGID